MALARQGRVARPAMLYAGDLLRQPPRVAWAPADILATPVVAAALAAPLFGVGMLFGRLFLGDGPRSGAHGLGAMVGLIVLYGSLFMATALLTVRKYRLPWDILRLTPVGRRGYAAVLPLLLAVNLICGVLAWLLSPLVSRSPGVANPQAADLLTSFSVSWGGLLGALFVVAVVAPIVEETYFRGMIYGLLRERYGVWPAVSLSAMIFAAAHVFVYAHYVLVAFPELCVLGVALACTVERTRSLYPAIVLHGLNNAVIVIVLFWSVAAAGSPLPL